MKKWVIVAIVLLAIVLSWYFVSKKKGEKKRKISGLSFPPVSGKPSMWLESAAPHLAKKLEEAEPIFASRVPTIAPTSMPPYTLGPVPNGLTRTPEPPTLRPAAASELEGPHGELYAFPAEANSTSVNGVQVKPVQNPWDPKSWEFLIGTDAKTTLEIVDNLFPNFPISARSASDPPSMSGALVLKLDNAKKVASIVRD
jgi:hypothetical protein